MNGRELLEVCARLDALERQLRELPTAVRMVLDEIHLTSSPRGLKPAKAEKPAG